MTTGDVRTTTLRDFTGGLNLVDSDLNLSPKYAPRLSNLHRVLDGSLATRPGTFKIARTGLASEIIHTKHFQNLFWLFLANGKIYTINIDGTGLTERWSSAIAGGYPHTPPPWSTGLTFVSTAVFNGKMVACNGIDKPLEIDLNAAFIVDYLVDAATGTNVNTPVCRYVAATNHFMLMAGDPVNPDRLHISHYDAHGTWSGDPAPNDAVQIDLGKVVNIDDQTITGIARFRDKVVIGMPSAVVVGTLGLYNTATGLRDHTAITNQPHEPQFADVILEHGVLGHHTMISTGSDLLFLSSNGPVSLQQALITQTLNPDAVYELVSPLFSAWTGNMTIGQAEDLTFAVYDSSTREYIVQLPRYFGLSGRSGGRMGNVTLAFSFSRRNKGLRSWSEFKGWGFRTAGRSNSNTIVFTDFDVVYAYGLIPEFGTTNFERPPHELPRFERAYFGTDTYHVADYVDSAAVTSERTTNGSFAVDIVGWTGTPGTETSWDIGDPVIGAGGTLKTRQFDRVHHDVILEPQRLYELTIDVLTDGSGWGPVIHENLMIPLAFLVSTQEMDAATLSNRMTHPPAVDYQHFGDDEAQIQYCQILIDDFVATGRPAPYTHRAQCRFRFYALSRDYTIVLFPPTTMPDGSSNPFFYYNTVSLKIAQDTGLKDIRNNHLLTPVETPQFIDWELPWATFGDASRVKKLVEISTEMVGGADFEVIAYADDARRLWGQPFPQNLDGVTLPTFGEYNIYDAATAQAVPQGDNVTELAPLLTLPATAGETDGYGLVATAIGGDRVLRDPRSWRLPIKFKRLKMRLKGSVIRPLRIVSLTFNYLLGTRRR